MTPEKQREAFQDELCKLIDRFTYEFDITVGDVVSILEIEKFKILAILHRLKQEKDEDE